MIKRWHHSTLTCHLLGILQGFGELADGIVTVLSLGFLMSGFEMMVSRYRVKRYLSSKRKKRP